MIGQLNDVEEGEKMAIGTTGYQKIGCLEFTCWIENDV